MREDRERSQEEGNGFDNRWEKRERERDLDPGKNVCIQMHEKKGFQVPVVR